MHFKNSVLGISINMAVLLVSIDSSVFNIMRWNSQSFFTTTFDHPKVKRRTIASVPWQGLISNICFCRRILLVEFLLGFHNSTNIVSKRNFCTT